MKEGMFRGLDGSTMDMWTDEKTKGLWMGTWPVNGRRNGLMHELYLLG